MTRSYDVKLAMLLGVREAVVLQHMAREHRQDNGRRGVCRSLREWRSLFPEFDAEQALLNLRSGGWVVTESSGKNPWRRTRYYALSDKAEALIKDIGGKEAANPDKPKMKPSPTAREIPDETRAEIDRLYSLYPGSTMTNEGRRSTGKCSKDKSRIEHLLKEHSPEQIERSMRRYVEETGGRYLKNFSTFLNNLPECDEEPPTPAMPDKYAHYE